MVKPLADPSVDLIIIVINIFDQTSDQTEHQAAVVHGGERRMKNSKSSPTGSSVKCASIRSDDGDVPGGQDKMIMSEIYTEDLADMITLI